jgi:hypothetical protein
VETLFPADVVNGGLLPAQAPQVSVPATTGGPFSPFASQFERDEYCLRVVATGSYAAAWKKMFPDSEDFGAAQRLASDPVVTARVESLTQARSQLPVSMADHADRVATIRDLAIAQEDLRTALAAETKLGELRGLYVKQVRIEEKRYNVTLPAPAATPEEWAQRYGQPVPKVEHPAIDVTPTRVKEEK